MKLPIPSAWCASTASATAVKCIAEFDMKITEDVRKYAAEQGIAEEEAIKKGMEAKSKEFVEKGAEVYAKM